MRSRIGLLVGVCALTTVALAARRPAELTVDYPSAGTIFPPEIAAPTLLWHDPSAAERWRVEVAFASGEPLAFEADAGPPPAGAIDERCVAPTNEVYRPTPYQASAKAFRPDAELWATLKRRSTGSTARMVVSGYAADRPDRVLSRGEVRFSTSTDPVGAPLFYRDVPLMPSTTKEGVIKPLDQSALPLIAWRLRDISQPESRVLLQEMPTCANCHSFSADGRTLGMDVDGPDGDKGAYTLAPIARRTVIRDENVMTWNAFPQRLPDHHTLGFMSRVSPDGRHVVSTVNEAIYVRNFTDYRFVQVFYPTRGILAVYAPETGRIESLPGADDPAYVHCNAVWTPDGKTLVYARATARDPYEPGRPQAQYAGDPNETPMRYDLVRIPFNDGRGGEAVPIVGASDNGMSNSFPKVSPDGKWVVFVQSRNGQLMRPDGKLWVVPLAGGEARPLESNLSLMNSWHSFSPNGRWLVFSSKSNTPYTQMFLTHFDEEGHASPAVLVENSTAANRAVNIPEFVNTDPDDFQSIVVPAVDHYQYFHLGNELAKEGRHAEAVVEFERALAGGERPWRVNDWRIHQNLSKSLLALGLLDQAAQHVRESLRLNPYNAEMHTNLGVILLQRGYPDEALEHLGAAIQLAPRVALHWRNRAAALAGLGRPEEAQADLDEAARLEGGQQP